MQALQVRRMTQADRYEVAELIYLSTNYWYQTHGRGPIFSGGPAVATVFFDVYESLDPGCGLLATCGGRTVGSCFYHPRPTHWSLGIMNAHPNYAGAGVARLLLSRIIELAEAENKPLRLVSSAMNLDSFSLYTRAGFVPVRTFQDMLVKVPAEGFAPAARLDGVRPARPDDVPAMVALERDIAGMDREKDFCYFIANHDGFWHASVHESAGGRIDAFCASCAHPGCNMVGPGAADSARSAAAVLAAELDRHRGRMPVLLAPADSRELVATLYKWGARNCELHFAQLRMPGAAPPPERTASPGLLMPTFLPESA